MVVQALLTLRLSGLEMQSDSNATLLKCKVEKNVVHVVPELCLLCCPVNRSGCKRESPTHFGAILSEFLLVESG